MHAWNSPEINKYTIFLKGSIVKVPPELSRNRRWHVWEQAGDERKQRSLQWGTTFWEDFRCPPEQLSMVHILSLPVIQEVAKDQRCNKVQTETHICLKVPNLNPELNMKCPAERAPKPQMYFHSQTSEMPVSCCIHCQDLCQHPLCPKY